MNLMALDKKTGRVLMSQSGSMELSAFQKTVLSLYPDATPDSISIIKDGAIISLGTNERFIKPPPIKTKAVVYKGSFVDAGGYANMNREIVFRLTLMGFSVKIDMLKTGMQVDAMTLSMLRALETTPIKNESACPLIVGFTPMAINAKKRPVIFYTMMETQSLHQEFVQRCNEHATEIWVPCNFYIDVFKKSGVVKPIHLMPLGVNEEIYLPNSPEPRLSYEWLPSGRIVQDIPQHFRYMSLFGWSYRKGTDILCKSFLREFSTADDVCLVIYSRHAGSSLEAHKEIIRKEIRDYYAEVGKPDAPPIYYCGDIISINDLPGCYSAADCFVFCSRGEGFGLPPVEAAACGIPVVCAYNTAMTQYLDDDSAFLVRPEGYAAANEKLTWISEYYRNQEFAVYGEKSIEEFSKAMRTVLENPKEAEEKAQKLRNRVLNEYTWNIASRRVAQRLKELT